MEPMQFLKIQAGSKERKLYLQNLNQIWKRRKKICPPTPAFSNSENGQYT